MLDNAKSVVLYRDLESYPVWHKDYTVLNRSRKKQWKKALRCRKIDYIRGPFVMGKQNYTQFQALLPEIKAMLAEEKTQREVAEYYGFKDKYVVKQLLVREHRKEQKLEAGIVPHPKGRTGKDAVPRDIVAK